MKALGSTPSVRKREEENSVEDTGRSDPTSARALGASALGPATTSGPVTCMAGQGQALCHTHKGMVGLGLREQCQQRLW